MLRSRLLHAAPHRRVVQASVTVILSLTLLLSACSGSDNNGSEPAAAEPANASNQQTADNGGDEAANVFVAPLTGQSLPAPLTERPIAVMVENSPAARPQTGLDQADIVFEILSEGDITRFIAFYHSQEPKTIGPVRSIRPYYVELGHAMDAVIVHAGWSNDAMAKMQELDVDHLDQVYGDHKYYWRDKSRKAPHNLYTSIEKAREGAMDRKFHEAWLDPIIKFVSPDSQTLLGQAVTSATMHYLNGYHVGYTYDPGTQLYQRSMKGKPHQDKLSGQTITAANVVMMKASHEILDKAGRRAIDVNGPGEAILLQKGLSQEVTWELLGGFIRFTDDTGRELGLVPGTTWIQVVPQKAKIELQ